MGTIIVIGAGVAGLAAAARLSRGGTTVIVLDRAPVAGGALATPGAHTLTLPAVYRDLFVKTGSRKKSAAAALEDSVDLIPVDPVRRYLFADGTRLDLPNSSRAGLLEAFDSAFGAGAGHEWLQVIEHGRAAWGLLRPAWFEAPRATTRDMWSLLTTRSGRRALTPRTNLRALSHHWFTNPRLGLLLDEYALGCGADPRQAPGILAVAPYLEHTFGAWRVAGGMSNLTEAIYQRALSRGVEVRLGCQVARITTATDGAVNGVELADGSHLPADTVIAAVDSARLAALTSPASPQPPAVASYSHSIFTVLLRVPAAAAMPHETVLFADHDTASVDARLAAVFGPAPHLTVDPTIRVCVTAEHPEAWAVHVPAPRHTADASPVPGALDWTAPSVATAYADKLVSILVRRGLVSITPTIERVITPADRELATGVPGGAAYGPATNGLRATLLRSPVVQPTPGLFHIGASARPGPGLPFAALSAWHVSELLNPRTTRST